MQIIGKKYLDENSYKSISIYDDKIIVSNGNSISDIRLEIIPTFTDELKGKTDYEIISSIVDYFINSGKVSYISKGVVLTEDGRKLKFSTLHDENIKRKIAKKYKMDREENLINSEGKVYSVGTSSVCSFYTSDNKYILSNKDDYLLNEELSFFKRMLDYKFNNDIAYLTRFNGYDTNYMEIISLEDTNKTIKLSNSLMKKYGSEIYEIVSQHNNSISNRNVKQLRLEV